MLVPDAGPAEQPAFVLDRFGVPTDCQANPEGPTAEAGDGAEEPGDAVMLKEETSSEKGGQDVPDGGLPAGQELPDEGPDCKQAVVQEEGSLQVPDGSVPAAPVVDLCDTDEERVGASAVPGQAAPEEHPSGANTNSEEEPVKGNDEGDPTSPAEVAPSENPVLPANQDPAGGQDMAEEPAKEGAPGAPPSSDESPAGDPVEI